MLSKNSIVFIGSFYTLWSILAEWAGFVYREKFGLNYAVVMLCLAIGEL